MAWPSIPFPSEQVSALRNSSEVPTTFTVTGDSTAHVKGVYTQLIASLSKAGYYIVLSIQETFISATDTAALLDLAIGAAESEVVIFSNLGAGYSDAYDSVGVAVAQFCLPFYIPSGSRLSARLQSVVTSKTALVSIDVLGGGGPGFDLPYYSACETYGANEATSNGVQVTAGSGGGKGAWVQIDGSTAEIIKAHMVSIGGVLTMANQGPILDIGTGVADSEVVIVADYPIVERSNERIISGHPRVIPIGISIPAGSRLAVRTACTQNNNSNLRIHLHGLRI